ncbi:MAG: DUF1361 domain-containing protein [Chitinophagaceae bacterium]
MIENTSLPLNLIPQQQTKTSSHGLLLTSVCFGFLLVTARTVYTREIAFLFLLWNLFLAFVPWYLSYTLSQRSARIKNKWIYRLLCIAWLLFVPNAFYMITDLFHLYDSTTMPRWYDLMMIFCFTWNALLLGILSVRHMEKLVMARWPRMADVWFVYPVMLLNAFGIYIGRFLRYNSWDIISNPLNLFSETIHILFHPVQYRNAWGMVLVFSFFLSIFYMTLKRLSKAL